MPIKIEVSNLVPCCTLSPSPIDAGTAIESHLAGIVARAAGEKVQLDLFSPNQKSKKHLRESYQYKQFALNVRERETLQFVYTFPKGH